MTEEEEIAYLQQIELLMEQYFRDAGYDIDMSEMSTNELEQFYFQLPNGHIEALRQFIAFEMTGKPPPTDVLDFGIEMAAPLYIPIGGGRFLPLYFPGSGAAKPAVQTAAKVARTFKPLAWLGRLLGIVDDVPIRVVGDTARTVVRKSGFGRVDDIARIGDELASGARQGSIPGVLGRTSVGSGWSGGWRAGNGRIGRTQLPHIDPDVLTGAQQVVGVGAATAVALETSRRFGADSNTVSTEQLHEEGYPGFEDEAFADKTPEEIEEIKKRLAAEKAQVETATVSSIINPNGSVGVMKQIYYEGLSETAAFDRLTNYIAGSGVNVLAESGISLGAALEQQESSAGMGGSLGEMHVYSLLDEPGRDAIRKYLQVNWERFPDIAEGLYGGYQTSGGFGGGAIPSMDNQKAMLDERIDEYIIGIQQNADFLLLTPENPDGSGDAIGFITSYDGTVNGGIVSFNDMFSGGKISHMNLLPELTRARPEQLAMWQQQLYAWGYLEKPPPVWGQMTPDAQGNNHTLDAAHRWQVAVFNEGVTMVRAAQRASPFTPTPSLSDLIAGDGTPRAERVLDRAIAKQMGVASSKATDAQAMRDTVLAQAQERVGNYLRSTGRYLPEGSAAQVQLGLDDALSGLSAERQESAFGQGGTPYERTLAENILSRLSQRNNETDNWKDVLTFGTTNRDSSFFDYAQRAGAVSERERTLLEDGVLQRGTYRDHWRDRYDQLKEAEADVAVASLLAFISQGMNGDFSTVTNVDISRGVHTYMNTVGIQQGLLNPMGEAELTALAQGALEDARRARFQPDNQMITDVATGAVDQMGLRGGVSGYQFKDLVDQLDSIRGVQKLGVRNV